MEDPRAERSTGPKTRVDRVDRRSRMGRAEFLREYGRPGRPLVLEGWARQWPACRRWTREFFRSRYGRVEVTVFRTDEPDETLPLTLGEYLEAMDRGGEAGSIYYLKDWAFGREFPELLRDYEVPELFPENWSRRLPQEFAVDWRWIYLGPPGSGTRMHVDVGMSSAWNATITGRKRWVFYPPDQESHLYGGEVDAFDPDLDRHPRFAQARGLHAVTRPGDVLFTPSGWWHQTLNETESLSVTENFVDETNIQAVLAHLRKEVPEDYELLKAYLLFDRSP